MSRPPFRGQAKGTWFPIEELVRDQMTIRVSGRKKMGSAEMLLSEDNTTQGHVSIRSTPFAGDWFIEDLKQKDNPRFEKCFYFITKLRGARYPYFGEPLPPRHRWGSAAPAPARFYSEVEVALNPQD
jgi:hypothetical protein